MTVTYKLTDDELVEMFESQLTDLLERRPKLEPRIFRAFMRTFVSKEDVAAIFDEIHALRAETRAGFEQVDQRFEQVDQRFEQVDQRLDRMDQHFEQVDQHLEQLDQRFDSLETRMEAGFQELHRAIDRLGSRWGIRNESIFRQTVAELLEKSFGVQVEQRWIDGEQFDCIIFDGQHILVEIAASVGPNIQQRLERKRDLYIQATGVTPARFILATAAIHSRRAMALREAGFEVIEPEEDALVG